MIVRTIVKDAIEAEKVERRVDFMRRTGILRDDELTPVKEYGCPPTGCVCHTITESLTCEHWKRMDVV